MAIAVLSGCVPIPGEVVDIDASTLNAPPVVVGAAPSPDFDFPGPLLVERSDQRTVTLSFRDNDPEDILYVRFFLDYDLKQPQGHQTCGSSQVPAPPEGVERSREFCMATWCAPLQESDTDFHTLEVVVADRPFDDTQQPAFRAVTIGGSSSTAVWRIKCEEAPQ